MSNDLPEKKKGLFSGLGNLLKGKEKETPVPEKDPKTPALRPAVQASSKTEQSAPPPVPVEASLPVSKPVESKVTIPDPSKPGKAQHFRDEFEMFLSDRGKGQPKSEPAISGSAPTSQSRKPQVVKSADLSKEFEFFTKPLKNKNREVPSVPVQGITAKAPVLAEPVKSTPPPSPVIEAVKPPAPAPVPAQVPPAVKSPPAAVPPPPPKIEPKPAVVEAPKAKPAAAAPVVVPVQKPGPATAASAPAPTATPSAKSPTPAAAAPEKKAAPTSPTSTPTPSPKPTPAAAPAYKSPGASPADIFAPRAKTPQAAPTSAPAPAPKPPVAAAKPTPSVPAAAPAVPPVSKKTEPPKVVAPVAPIVTPPPAPAVQTPVPVKATTPPVTALAAAVSAATPAPAAKTSDLAAGSITTTDGKQSIKKVELDPGRKRRTEVVLPPIVEIRSGPQPSKAGKGEKNKRRAALIWIAVVILLVVLAATGAYIYEITRETSAEFSVATDDLTLSGVPLVIYNFDGQVSQIKRDYAERRGPMETRLQQIESDLASAKADLAGREEKKRLLTAEIKKLRDSIPLLMQEGEKKLDRLWKEEGGALDKAYADQKESLHKEIEKRAKDLGLKYERNPELDALEVAVNAFRLSLYGAPKTVNVDEQRIFSEDILKRWRDFEKDWGKKQFDIKEKAMQIKQSPAPRIEDTERSIEAVKVDLEALNVDVASLQEEVGRRQQDEVEEQQKLGEVEKPFLSDLLKIPANNILREVPAGKGGKFELRNLEKSTDMLPGDYVIFVQAQKGDEIFWAIKPFSIAKHKNTRLQILRQDFAPIRKLIQ